MNKNTLLLGAGIFGLVAIALVVILLGQRNTNQDNNSQNNSNPTLEENNQTIDEIIDYTVEDQQPSLTVEIDGEDWKGVSTTFYYPNGNAFLSDTDPYFQMSFYSPDEKDGRNLVIQVVGFKPEVGKYKGTMEVLFNGDVELASGETKEYSSGYQDDLPEQKTDFTFEITDWKSVSAAEALVSAKFSGTLKGFFGGDDVLFSNGVVTDAEVSVY